MKNKIIYYDIFNNYNKLLEYTNSWCYEYQLQGLKNMLKSYNMIVKIR